MKVKTNRLLALAGAVFLVTGGLACCGEDGAVSPAGEGSGGGFSGTIQMVGSTSMTKLANALAESFMDKYPNVTVSVEFVGSGAGIEAVNNGGADIGNSSRRLKEEEKAKGAVENIVALDGIAVCVDGKNQIGGLTSRQLTEIYTGAVTNWSDVGGCDMPVVVIGREAGSGSREVFEELLGIEGRCAYANELDTNGAVMARVSRTPGAIGYVSMDVMDSTVRALALDGVEPTAENIRAGSYFLSRPLVMATKGAVSEQNDLIRAWFAFCYGEEGQDIVSRLGLIAVHQESGKAR